MASVLNINLKTAAKRGKIKVCRRRFQSGPIAPHRIGLDLNART
jgi:hypothetical protein